MPACFGEYQQKKIQNNNNEDGQPDHPDQFWHAVAILPLNIR
jgi:hypothetical protein